MARRSGLHPVRLQNGQRHLQRLGSGLERRGWEVGMKSEEGGALVCDSIRALLPLPFFVSSSLLVLFTVYPILHFPCTLPHFY